MDPEESRLLTEAVTALGQHLAERNRLQAQANLLYEQCLALGRERSASAEETNRLYLRSVAQEEENGRLYRQRLADERVQQRRSWVALALMFIGLLAALALLSVVHHHPA